MASTHTIKKQTKQKRVIDVTCSSELEPNDYFNYTLFSRFEFLAKEIVLIT